MRLGEIGLGLKRLDEIGKDLVKGISWGEGGCACEKLVKVRRGWMRLGDAQCGWERLGEVGSNVSS